MALLLLSSRSVTRAGIRAVSMREVVTISVVACTVVGTLAFVAGLSIGRQSSAVAVPAVAQNDPVREGFAMQKLGEISARMMALESNASTLLKKLTGIEQIQGNLDKLQKPGILPPSRNKDAAGGPELAPLCDVRGVQATGAEGVKQAEGALSCLQSLIQRIDESAASRNITYMALPNRSPLPGAELGSPFGNRVDPINGHVAFHPGLDFAAQTGTSIFSAGGGKVRFAGWQSELGNLVEIDHGNGLVSRYAHTSKILVKEGDIVAPGQKLALVGSTGRSTGPHLHFEILRAGRYLDPMPFLATALRNETVASKF